MTKAEAIAALKAGKKVIHPNFLPGEYVFINFDGKFEFEDGVEMTEHDFWLYRSMPSFENDWEIFNENK